MTTTVSLPRSLGIHCTPITWGPRGDKVPRPGHICHPSSYVELKSRLHKDAFCSKRVTLLLSSWAVPFTVGPSSLSHWLLLALTQGLPPVRHVMCAFVSVAVSCISPIQPFWVTLFVKTVTWLLAQLRRIRQKKESSGSPGCTDKAKGVSKLQQQRQSRKAPERKGSSNTMFLSPSSIAQKTLARPPS